MLSGSGLRQSDAQATATQPPIYVTPTPQYITPGAPLLPPFMTETAWAENDVTPPYYANQTATAAASIYDPRCPEVPVTPGALDFQYAQQCGYCFATGTPESDLAFYAPVGGIVQPGPLGTAGPTEPALWLTPQPTWTPTHTSTPGPTPTYVGSSQTVLETFDAATPVTSFVTWGSGDGLATRTDYGAPHGYRWVRSAFQLEVMVSVTFTFPYEVTMEHVQYLAFVSGTFAGVHGVEFWDGSSWISVGPNGAGSPGGYHNNYSVVSATQFRVFAYASSVDWPTFPPAAALDSVYISYYRTYPPTSTPPPTWTPYPSPTPTGEPTLTPTPRTGGFVGGFLVTPPSCYVPRYADQSPMATMPLTLTYTARECYQIVPYIHHDFGEIGGIDLPVVHVDDVELCVSWFEFPAISLLGGNANGGIDFRLDWLLLMPLLWLVTRLLQF